MRRTSLKRKVASLPEGPGVYFFKDRKGRTLYIGKAKSLRDRVGTYFTPSYGDARLRRMIARICDVDVVETPSEVEALLAEARLIRDTQPYYNARQRDDKSFAMLEITRTDDFPKIAIVHETDEPRGDRIGPFTSSAELREAVRILQRVFRFATCTLEMREDDRKRRFFRPCLLHAIDRCSAPCAARISREDYGASIDAFQRFVLGDREGVIRSIEKEMRASSSAKDYERAGELRDRARALRGLAKRADSLDYVEGDITPIHPEECLADLERALGVRPRRIEGVDIATLGGGEAVGSLVMFVDGAPFKDGYRRYRIRSVEGMDDFAMIREVVGRRFRRLRDEGLGAPDVLLIDGGVGQLNAAAEAIDRSGLAPRELVSLAKREETLFRRGESKPVALRPEDPGLRLLMYVRDEAHRFAQHYHHILRRKTVLEEWI